MRISTPCCFEDSESFKGFMTSVQEDIKSKLGEGVFTSWFKDLFFKSYDGETMLFTVTTEKIKNCIFLHYQAKFERIIQKNFAKHFTGRLKHFEILVEQNQIAKNEIQEDLQNLPQEKSKYNIGIELDKKYTFSNFLETEENKLAVGFARHFASLTKSDKENILQFSKQFCICGHIGNGKTHLAQSIAHDVKSFGFKVVYTTSEKFMLNFQNAVRRNESVDFTSSFFGVKLLIIDDIHFIASKKKTIEEVQRIAYSVISDGGFVLFCSTSSPRNLPIESRQAQSFISASHEIKLENPTESFRYKLLKFKAEKSSYKISDSVLKILSSKIHSNIRELEGAMGRMVLHSQILNCDIDKDAANFITTDIFPHKELRKFSAEEVQDKVSIRFGITKPEIISKKRTKSILKARQIAIFLCTKLTTLSYVEIGKCFLRTHSTVIHSIKAIEKETKESRLFKEDIDLLRASIEQNL